MKKFEYISTLIKEARIETGMSQSQLSAALGYRNGQFISNVERGLCGIPLNKTIKLSYALNLSHEDIAEAMIKDYTKYVTTTLLGGENDRRKKEGTDLRRGISTHGGLRQEESAGFRGIYPDVASNIH